MTAENTHENPDRRGLTKIRLPISVLREWTRIRRAVNGSPLPAFILYIARRFIGDNGPQAASGLSYASLLALVPLLAIMLAIVSAFPAFSGLEERILDAILSDALPPMEVDATSRIRDFIENATALTGPGIFGLSLTAILLLSNINSSFNTIWRVSEARAPAMRFLVYWALLTLGPLLLAVSLSASATVFAAIGADTVTTWARWLVPPWLISLLFSALGFGILFFVVPNRPVHVPHALVGGVVTASAFEALKVAFAIYLASVPGYQAVYGALAAVPIFLVWLYLSWAAVLVGAEVTAALPEWRAYRHRAGETWAGERLTLAIAMLERLWRAQHDGIALSRGRLVANLPAAPGEVDGILTPLRRAGIIARTSHGRWVLGADLRRVTMGRVMNVLGVSLMPSEAWPKAAHDAVWRLADLSRDWAETDLETVLQASPTPENSESDGSRAATS